MEGKVMTISYSLSELYMGLDDFFEGDRRNDYVYHSGLILYLRKRVRYINYKRVNVIDIGSITNPKRQNNIFYNKNHKRTGLLEIVLTDIETIALTYGFEGLFVENVMNEFLGPVLMDHYNFKRVDENGKTVRKQVEDELYSYFKKFKIVNRTTTNKKEGTCR